WERVDSEYGVFLTGPWAPVNEAGGSRRAEGLLGNPDLVAGEGLEPVGGDEVIPLEPHAADALDVQAGLEGDDIADHQRFVAAGDQVGGLGVAEAQAVAGVRAEVGLEAQGREMPPDGGVDISSPGPGLQ